MIKLPQHVRSLRGTPHQHLIFANAKSTDGEPVPLNWNQFSYFMQMAGHEQIHNKLSAKLFTPWTPRAGATGRKSDGIAYSSMLVFDLDKIDTLDCEDVKSWCGKYSALIHTSFSHGVDGFGCFRIYMPLSRPVNASEYKIVHAGILANLPGLTSRVDPTCADFARCYFLPACPPERHHLAAMLPSLGGFEVDADMLLSMPDVGAATTKLGAGALPVTGAPSYSHAIVMPAPARQGGRNMALCSALGSAFGKGFTPEAVMPAAQAWGQSCQPPMDAAEVEATVKSMWNTHSRNHPPIANAEAATASRNRLLTAIELATLPALQWRVKGLLPAKGLASIYGPSGSGKTFVALDIACAISGWRSQWFGSKVKGAPVAYVALEGSGGISQRVKAWEAHNKIAAPAAIRFILGGFTLLEAHHAERLASEILATLGPGTVIFIDTLNQSAPGADENSSVDMGTIIANAKVLAEAVNGMVVLIHHTGKDSTKGPRGHSSLFAALDAVIEVVSATGGRAWRATKTKDDAPGTAHGFELVSYPVGRDEDGDEIRSCAVRPSFISTGQTRKAPTGKNQKTALQLLASRQADYPDGFPQVEAVRLVAGAFSGPDGRKNSRAKEAIESLVESGHLVLGGGRLSIP